MAARTAPGTCFGTWMRDVITNQSLDVGGSMIPLHANL